MDVRFDRMKIGVVGLVPGAGAGFVSTCLAGALAETGKYSPALLELGGEGLYDVLAMDKHFAGRDYFPFFQSVAGDRSIRCRNNLMHGVNWALKSPPEYGITLDLLKMIRMANHTAGDMILCKIGSMQEEDLWRLLWDMDRVLVVIDPLPSRMLAGHKFLCALRTSGLPILYLINKMNGGVSRRELLNYLKLKKPHYLPMFEPEIIYSAEYSCRLPYDLNSSKTRIKKSMTGLIGDLLDVQLP